MCYLTLWIQQFPILSNQVERDSAVIIRKVPAANNATIVVLVEPLTAEAITQSDEIAQLLYRKGAYCVEAMTLCYVK